MGLLDILNGMQNGPRGERAPNSGGMSPITMALLGLLAYKAIKSMGGSQAGTSAPGAGQAPQPGGNAGMPDLGGLLGGALGGAGGGLGGGLAGGLGDMLKGGLGGLGGLLAGGAAGSVLSGGLNDLLKQFQQNGQGETASTWVGTGPNKEIDPSDLASALGGDQIKSLMSQSGLSRDELLQGLSQHLPTVVDYLTPNGQVPTEQELSRLV